MFSVSAKTQYAIRALVHLARVPGGEACVAEIGEAEGISPKYLEGILNTLRLQGIVTSVRGKGGGYRLNAPATETSMLDIVTAVDGAVNPVACSGSSGCSREGSCLPRRFWTGLKDTIEQYLSSVSLAALADLDETDTGEKAR